MNNFIKEVLLNEKIMRYCFDYDKFNFNEKNKIYLKQSFEELRQRNDKILNFILDNTEFIYITSNRQYIGVLDKFVIYFDDEFSLKYLCHGFENIPALLIQDKELQEGLEMEAFQLGINYNQIHQEYLDLLKKYNLTFNLITNSEEFEDYLIKNLK